MFHWYQASIECYAVLSDLPNYDDRQRSRRDLPKSDWCTRGWTLQELLARTKVMFYDSSWKLVGSKEVLAEEISESTGISTNYLHDSNRLSEASVALKMSWASQRQTTRVEDTAYSLLGLFGVNMPLLYGEDKRKIFRLQLEVFQTTDDESIFAWASKDMSKSGMFAPWPSAFRNSGNVRPFAVRPAWRVPWSWTNKGLEMRLIEPDSRISGKGFDLMPIGQHNKLVTLACWEGSDHMVHKEDKSTWKNKVVSIELERLGTTWQRINCQKLQLVYEFDAFSRSRFVPLVLRQYYIPQEKSNAIEYR